MPASLKRALLGAAALLSLASAATIQAADAQPTPSARPWMNPALSADQRADLLIHAMTLPEKLTLVYGYFGTDASWKAYVRPKESLADSAGFVYGIPRLGVPSQWETDAGLGVATQRTPHPRERTSLPSGLATAATWNPALATAGGAMIGNEAFLSGFNVLLAGGVDLVRDPRNGRNFEYAGEDPLLAGLIVGAEIKGVQTNPVVSTLKHYAFNDQETNRFSIDVKIGDQAARTSDLLAFEIGIEAGHPGSVMCAYNRVNGVYACENDYLLNQVLKSDWRYPGYVMSDWGATHSTIPAANNGLDQESGWMFDVTPYFSAALHEAVLDGYVSPARLDDMDHRILRSMFENGLFDHPVAGDRSDSIDYAGHLKIAQADAEEAIVLLKNRGALLPLTASAKRIVLIGGHADVGVLSGGGSSQVYPRGGLAVPNEGPDKFPGPEVYFPSSPMRGIKAHSAARVTYSDGKDIAAAARAAADSDIAIVFATQWLGESVDAPNLNLPNNQDALIAAVAKANRKTVVVLETSGPVVMPWAESVGAIVEAWYPGSGGGEAIARVLTGEVDASGRLPVTFPLSQAQLPRPVLDGDAAQDGGDERPKTHTDYDIEGAAVGYKWFDLKGLKPLFAFGHGLSYTRFALSGLRADLSAGQVTAHFRVANTGARTGKAVPQIYVSSLAGGWEAPQRLGGWTKLELAPGVSADAAVAIDPRLLAVYDSTTKTWRIAEGDYKLSLAQSAEAPVMSVTLHLPARTLDVQGR
jgi:beta-glucosidase